MPTENGLEAIRATSELNQAISVVLATRNRSDHVAECVATILANPGLHQLIVVDQSDDGLTEDRLSKIFDNRVMYVRSDTRGVTSARNLGIQLSDGAIIAFTDDDCRVAADWTRTIANVFGADPDAAVVCGRVRVPEEIQHLGFTESFEPHVREWRGRYPPFGRDWGITANMALRREVIALVGDFDPMLGAGAPLRSGGEPDFLYRVLRSGLKIVNAREVVVEHLGVRAFGAESQKLIRGYGAGTGAAIYKHVRLGDPQAVRLYFSFVIANVSRIFASLIQGRGPVGLGYLLAFFAGSLNSYRFTVDSELRRYARR